MERVLENEDLQVFVDEFVGQHHCLVAAAENSNAIVGGRVHPCLWLMRIHFRYQLRFSTSPLSSCQVAQTVQLEPPFEVAGSYPGEAPLVAHENGKIAVAEVHASTNNTATVLLRYMGLKGGPRGTPDEKEAVELPQVPRSLLVMDKIVVVMNRQSIGWVDFGVERPSYQELFSRIGSGHYELMTRNDHLVIVIGKNLHGGSFADAFPLDPQNGRPQADDNKRESWTLPAVEGCYRMAEAATGTHELLLLTYTFSRPYFDGQGLVRLRLSDLSPRDGTTTPVRPKKPKQWNQIRDKPTTHWADFRWKEMAIRKQNARHFGGLARVSVLIAHGRRGLLSLPIGFGQGDVKVTSYGGSVQSVKSFGKEAWVLVTKEGSSWLVKVCPGKKKREEWAVRLPGQFDTLI